MFEPGKEYPTRNENYTGIVLEVVGEKSIGYWRHNKSGKVGSCHWDKNTGRRYHWPGSGECILDLMPPEPEIEISDELLNEMLEEWRTENTVKDSFRKVARIAIQWDRKQRGNP